MLFNYIYIFYLFIIFSSFLMIISNNPIHSVLFFISIFINTSIIFILYNVDFLGLLLLIVYVGAIAILFLFVVMMINIKKIENDNISYLFIGFSIFFILFLQFCYLFFDVFINYIPRHLLVNINEFEFFNYAILSDEYNRVSVVKKIGIYLFLKYYLFVFFSGLLLLVSLIGCIFLTNFKKGYSMRKQYNQYFRKYNLINLHIY